MKYFKYLFIALACMMILDKANGQQETPCPDDMILTPLVTNPNSTLVPYVVPDTDIEKNNTGNKVLKDRLISWVHGLGGSPDSWILASVDIQWRYRTNPIRPSYTQQSLQAGGQTLFNHMQQIGFPVIQQYNLDVEDSFVIAHSHGGLSSRSAFKYQTELGTEENAQIINGIVTFGTGHAGAEIAGNQQEIMDWIIDGSSKLANTYVYLSVSSSGFSFFVNSVIEDILGKDVATIIENSILDAVDFLGNFLIPQALSPFIEPVTSEIVPGAPELAALNSWSPSEEDEIPTVAFYGIEEDPVLWRYVSSVVFDKTNSHYGDDYDETVPNAIDDLIIEHEAMSELFYTNWELETSDDCEPWELAILWLQGVCLADEISDNIVGHEIIDSNGDTIGTFLVSEMYTNYLNFQSVKNWFENANFNWKLIIGAAELDVVTSCSCDVFINGNYSHNISADPGNLSCYEFANENSTDVYTYSCYENGWTNVDFFDSDGVTTVASQMAYPDVGSLKRMENTNHQQMRNCTKTKDRLDELMRGDHGDYFTTKKK